MTVAVGERTEWVVLQRDDGRGNVGPRGTPEPNWIDTDAGYAAVEFARGTDPAGLAGQVEPEQMIEVAGFRRTNTVPVIPGHRVVYDDRHYEIISVQRDTRPAAFGELTIIAVDRRAGHEQQD